MRNSDSASESPVNVKVVNRKPKWSFNFFRDRESRTISKEKLHEYEERVLRGTADTFRTLHEHETFEANNIDLSKEMEGKIVGDLGSGLGGLAKSAFVEGIDTEVYSFNPSLDRPEFKQAEEKGSARELKKHYPGISSETIQAAQNYHDEHLILDFAYDLQPVRDSFFDLLVDTTAVHAYFSPEDKDIYEMSVKEMMRVLKPGGKIFIEDGFRWAIGEKDRDGKICFKEEILQKLGIRYEILYVEDTIGGAIIYKD